MRKLIKTKPVIVVAIIVALLLLVFFAFNNFPVYRIAKADISSYYDSKELTLYKQKKRTVPLPMNDSGLFSIWEIMLKLSGASLPTEMTWITQNLYPAALYGVQVITK